MSAATGSRLHVVTGKGGTGKTTVATALAMALAADGRRTLLAEVEGRQGIAELFGVGPLPYEERPLADVPGGGRVFSLVVDPETALLEYLQKYYRLGIAGRALRRAGAIDVACTIAPGLRDVLLTGKIKEAVTRTASGRRVYDAVVLDAPPTGRVGRFLNVTTETAKLAKIGPIKSQSEGVSAVLRSPMTAVHLVTLLEEMSVQETTDSLAELDRLGIPTGAIIINRASLPALGDVIAPPSTVRRQLCAAGLPCDRATVDGLISEGQAHRSRLAVQASLRAELQTLDKKIIELPALAEAVTSAALGPLTRGLAPLLPR